MQLLVKKREFWDPKGGSYTVSQQGSKNSAFPVLTLAILCSENSTVKNVPSVLDVENFVTCLRELGVAAAWTDGRITFTRKESEIGNASASPLAASIRASLYLIPIMLMANDECCLRLPGGCDLGDRGIGVHVKTLNEFGYECVVRDGNLVIRRDRVIKKCVVDFAYPSHIGSNLAMLLSIATKIPCEIRGLAPQPEVSYLSSILRHAGCISDCADHNVTVSPALEYLTEFQVMTDRIVLFSEICLGLANGLSVHVPEDVISLLEPELAVIEQMGVTTRIAERICVLKLDPEEITNERISVVTGPFPFFTTDNQPALVALCAAVGVRARVVERMFASRFKYVEDLAALDVRAHIGLSEYPLLNGHGCSEELVLHSNRLHENSVEGNGPDGRTHPGFLTAPDLRGGYAFLIYCSARAIDIRIENYEQVTRGYNKVESMLEQVGCSCVN